MSDRDVILSLAKVIIAAAWADEEITIEEINSLKDLIYRLPRTMFDWDMQITGREWKMLEMYLETPVGAVERARLVEELQAVLRTPKDKMLTLSALANLMQADGDMTAEEQAVKAEIETALEAVDLGLISQLKRLIQGPIQRRSQAVANAPNREEYFADFIKNRVYYAVRQHLNLGEAELDIPEADLRKLSLAGGLMARVAHVDREVTESEFDKMTEALQSGWDMSRDAAAFVAEVAVSTVGANMDYFRMTREFFNITTEEERLHFLPVLFAVAKADGHISYEENEEIRSIARSLNLSSTQFVEAKSKVAG